MYAAELLIERLEEQIKLAPQLEPNTAPGGSIAEMVERLNEGENRANHIPVLRAVESGSRRYGACLRKAREHVERLKPLLDSAAATKAATYADGEQRAKAMGRHEKTPSQIVGVCKAAIVELEKALAILDEGEKKEARQPATAGAK